MKFNLWHLFALTTISAVLVFPAKRAIDSMSSWLEQKPNVKTARLKISVVSSVLIIQEEEPFELDSTIGFE